MKEFLRDHWYELLGNGSSGVMSTLIGTIGATITALIAAAAAIIVAKIAKGGKKGPNYPEPWQDPSDDIRQLTKENGNTLSNVRDLVHGTSRLVDNIDRNVKEHVDQRPWRWEIQNLASTIQDLAFKTGQSVNANAELIKLIEEQIKANAQEEANQVTDEAQSENDN